MSSKADGSSANTKQSEQPLASYLTDYESAQVKLIHSRSNNLLRAAQIASGWQRTHWLLSSSNFKYSQDFTYLIADTAKKSTGAETNTTHCSLGQQHPVVPANRPLNKLCATHSVWGMSHFFTCMTHYIF